MAENTFDSFGIWNMTIPYEQMMTQIDSVFDYIEEAEEEIKDVTKEAVIAVRRATNLARIGWGLIQGVVRMGGEAISITHRLIISSVLGGIKVVYPLVKSLLHAGVASMNPMMIMEAMIGIFEISSAIAALVAYQQGEKKLSLQFRGLNFALQNISLGMGVTQI
jgi:hypothetical protein